MLTLSERTTLESYCVDSYVVPSLSREEGNNFNTLREDYT